MANEPLTRRRGRPASTSPRDLELIALQLFHDNGYDATTVEDIAAAAGVSSRTFFRYFDTKADVLWYAFDSEVEALRAALAEVPAEVPLLDAIRLAVVGVNHYTADDMPELRARIQLIGSVPTLQAAAALHYDAWEQAIIDYAAKRLRAKPDALLPLAIGRATLAVCRAAYEIWVNRADTALQRYLDEALTAMAYGFVTERAPTRGPQRARRR